jgi:hypothetical protein
MGDINPSKMPGAKKARRKDGDEFTKYAKGGVTKKIKAFSGLKGFKGYK